MATTEPQATGLRAEGLQPLLDGRYASLRRQLRDILSRPEFEPPISIPTAEYRDRVLDWMRTIAAEGLTADALVDASGIPDQVLRAPIAQR